jgi:NitT/TauT family transport system substrate-binding protein
MKRLMSIVVAIALVGSLCVGFATVKQSAKAPQRIKMRVAYMPNMGSASTMITAIKMGYFEEQGIDVVPVKFAKGPEEIAAMGSGNIDVSQIGHGAHALCAKGQARIFSIDCTSLSDEVLGNTDKGIKTIADLKGKTIATSLGTSSEIILNLALASVGMTQADVKVIQMDPSAAVTAMVTGKIDACAIWSPSTIVVKEKLGKKCVILANNKTYEKKMVFPSSWICTNEYYNKNKDKLIRFTAALLKAENYKKANIVKVSEWVAKLIEQDPAVIKQSVGEANWLDAKTIFIMAKTGTLKTYYTNQQKVFVTSGALAKAVNVDNYFSPNIIIKAFESMKK